MNCDIFMGLSLRRSKKASSESQRQMANAFGLATAINNMVSQLEILDPGQHASTIRLKYCANYESASSTEK